MKPNYHPEGLFDDNKVSSTTKSKDKEPHIPQLWHRYGKCAEGTIPMRRTKEDDVLRASSVKRYGKKKHRTVPLPKSAEPDLINQSGHQVSQLWFVSFYLCWILDLTCVGFLNCSMP